MSAPSLERRQALLDEALRFIDPRLAQRVAGEFAAALGAPPRCQPNARGGIVLAGHRAAGKTRLLPIVAAALDRPAVDLDAQIALRAGRSARDLFSRDPAAFRAAERARFAEVPERSVVAVGGGFLSLHADLLTAFLTVEVPISEATYRERLLADRDRPRLRPELEIDAELAQVFREREVAHATVPRWSLAEFAAWVRLPEGGSEP
jgi:shikimate kinase